MTDRIHSLTLVLERNIRIDDAGSLIEAAKHLRGVIDVKPNVADHDSYIAESRAAATMRTTLAAIVNLLYKPGGVEKLHELLRQVQKEGDEDR